MIARAARTHQDHTKTGQGPGEGRHHPSGWPNRATTRAAATAAIPSRGEVDTRRRRAIHGRVASRSFARRAKGPVSEMAQRGQKTRPSPVTSLGARTTRSSGAGGRPTRTRTGARARTGPLELRRLGRHDDGPLAPGVRQVSMHLAGTLVQDEAVERLAGIGHLKSTVPLDGAELRRAHTFPSRGLGHTLGQHERGPNLQACGGTGRLAGLQGVDGLAAHQDRAKFRVLGRRHDDLGRRTGRTVGQDQSGQPTEGHDGTGHSSKWHLACRGPVLRSLAASWLVSWSDLGASLRGTQVARLWMDAEGTFSGLTSSRLLPALSPLASPLDPIIPILAIRSRMSSVEPASAT